MSHMEMGHVTHRNESCHIWEWVISHIGISHVTYGNESCHTYGNGSFHTLRWVISHIRMSHVTHRNGSCHIQEWVMSHLEMWQRRQTLRLHHTATHCNTLQHTATLRRLTQQLHDTALRLKFSHPTHYIYILKILASHVLNIHCQILTSYVPNTPYSQTLHTKYTLSHPEF